MASKENLALTLELIDKLIAKSNCKDCWNRPEINTTKYCKECTFARAIDTFQQAIDDLELYKKAFELLSLDYFNSLGSYYIYNREEMKNKYLSKAKGILKMM